jgi:hypothetical protein
MLALSLALLLAAAPLGGFGPQTIQPCNLSSASGEWTARTDPSSKRGDGPSHISVWHGAERAWEAEVPFSFWDAQLSDEGQLAGYAFTEGRMSVGAKGEFVVALFGPDGRALREERQALTWAKHPDFPPNPYPLGLFLQPALDRFVLRVADEDWNRQQESWWTYRLTTGELIGKIQPKERLESPGGVVRSIDARRVPGTPLTLVQWYQSGSRSREEFEPGTRFMLLDADWKPVWTLELARDYAHADEAEADRLRDEAWAHGGILAADEPGRFELRHVAAQERVSYAVEADPASASGWTVRELTRSPYVPTVAKSDEWPSLELRKIASVPLQAGPRPAAGPVHDVLAFDFDAVGAVRLVRKESAGGYTLLTIAPDENVTEQARVDELAPGAEGTRAWDWIQNERWLLTLSPFGDDVVARAWFVDAVTGSVREIEDFGVPSVGTVGRLPGGGFALHGSFIHRSAGSEVFAAFDASGHRLWKQIESGDDGSEENISSAQALGVDPDGSLLLFGSDRRVQFFDRDGRFQRAVKLGGLDKAAYLARFRVEPAGTWLVFQSSLKDGGRWHRFNRDGVELASFGVNDADGTPATPRGPERIDPAGGLWCTDGQALFRLDESGVLRPRFGSAPDAEVLEEPDSIQFDDSGRLAVVDRRSHSIHLFRASGERERVLHPDPGDFEQAWWLQAFASAPDGRLFVPSGNVFDRNEARFLEFAPDGRRVGWAQPGGDLLAFRADGGRWVAKGARFSACSVTALSPAGAAEVSFARRPNGDFHLAIDAIDCRPDGSLAVLSGADDDRLELDLYSPAGEPLRTIDLHAAGGRYWNRLSQSERWILVSSFHTEALLVPRDGSAPSRVRVNESSRDDGCTLTLSPDGAELWCATCEPLALHRFALPESR